MSEGEVQDEVQQHDSPQAEETPPVVTDQEAPRDEPDGHPEAQAGEGSQDGAHPLEPGGKRFNQVYARAKDAELKYHAERERAARLEGELEALKRQPVTPAQPVEKRYTPAQLQAFVDEGKITVGQVLAYQEETIRQEMERKLDAKLTEKLAGASQQTTLQREINKYRESIPEVEQPGTPERTKLEQEFTYLIQLGYDKNDPRTELMAARAAFGDPDLAKQKRQAKSITTPRETIQDIASNGSPKPAEKDPLKQLTSEQRKHYQRMIDRGVYKGWSEVKEELAYVPGR